MLNQRRFRLSKLIQNQRGGAVVETAILLPTLLALGLGGIELTNLALTHMRISQAASALSDSASRISIETGTTIPQVREADVNELLRSVIDRHAAIELQKKGRVILSSLEQNSDGGQWIHWQRCVGDKIFASTFGPEGAGSAGTSLAGMGDEGRTVKAPPGAAVMFVEIAYDYQPIAYGHALGPKTIRYTSSFLVRDERDLSQIYNPAPAAPIASCG